MCDSTKQERKSRNISIMSVISSLFVFLKKHQDARAIHGERIVLSNNVTGDWLSAPSEEVCLTASPSAVIFSSRIPLWEFWQDSESPYLLEPTSLSSPRVLFTLKPPSLESSFHQNFLPFSLLLPRFSEAHSQIPCVRALTLSHLTPALSPESPTQQGPLFPYPCLLSSESSSPQSPQPLHPPPSEAPSPQPTLPITGPLDPIFTKSSPWDFSGDFSGTSQAPMEGGLCSILG